MAEADLSLSGSYSFRNSNSVNLISSLLVSDPIPKLINEREAQEEGMSVSLGTEMRVAITKTLDHEIKN